jgi:hypothetical protein
MTKYFAILALIAAASIGPALAQTASMERHKGYQRCMSDVYSEYHRHILECKKPQDQACINAANAATRAGERRCHVQNPL